MKETQSTLLTVPWETALIGFFLALPFIGIKRHLVRVLICAVAPIVILTLVLYFAFGLSHGAWRLSLDVGGQGLELVVSVLGYVVGGLCAAHINFLWPSEVKRLFQRFFARQGKRDD